MYIMHNSQQFGGPKEVVEAFNSCFFSTSLPTIPRLTYQTLFFILYNTKKIENAFAVGKPSYRTASGGVSLPYFASTNQVLHFIF